MSEDEKAIVSSMYPDALLRYVIDNSEYLTDPYYSSIRRAIISRYEYLTGASVESVNKRFFQLDDLIDGEHYLIVSSDLISARQIMLTAGVVFGDPGKYLDEAESLNHVRWIELPLEVAKARKVDTSEEEIPRGLISLFECEIGDWYSSYH